jgi:hypothetical protein
MNLGELFEERIPKLQEKAEQAITEEKPCCNENHSPEHNQSKKG